MLLPDPKSLIHENKRLVAESGEPFGILNEGAIEAAVVRVYYEYLYGGEDRIPKLALKLLFAISRAHAFQQGNKRTAYLAMLDFITGNGYSFKHYDDTQFAVHMKAVIVGRMSEAHFFSKHIAPFCVPDTLASRIAVVVKTRVGKRLHHRFGRRLQGFITRS